MQFTVDHNVGDTLYTIRMEGYEKYAVRSGTVTHIEVFIGDGNKPSSVMYCLKLDDGDEHVFPSVFATKAEADEAFAELHRKIVAERKIKSIDLIKRYCKDIQKQAEVLEEYLKELENKDENRNSL